MKRPPAIFPRLLLFRFKRLFCLEVIAFSLVAHGAVFDWGHYYNDNVALDEFEPAEFPQSDGSTNSVSIAAGGGHTLTLNRGGTIRIWGDLRLDEVISAPEINDGMSIGAGLFHSLVLRKDGTVMAWGRNDSGQCNVPEGLKDVFAVTGSDRESFALQNNGRIAAWGGEISSQSLVTLSNVVCVSGSQSGGYAVKADGTVWRIGATEPTLVEGVSNVVTVASAATHALALRNDGTIYGWGDNSVGQLDIPAGLSNVVAIAAAGAQSLALGLDGSVWAWGQGSLDQEKGEFGKPILPDGLSNVVAISAGPLHGVAITGEGPPNICIRPAPRVVTARSTTWLYAQASGELPLYYQWRFKGADIPGATNHILALTNLVPAHTGLYSLVVTNAKGLTTNETTVNVVPFFIAENPSGRSVMPGGVVSFSVSLTGVGPFNYQWKFNDQDIAGATSAKLVLTNVTTSEIGRYSVSVSNEFGAMTTTGAPLSLTTLAIWGGNAFGQTNIPPGLGKVIGADASFGHVAAVKDDGSVIAWGRNQAGETDVLPGISNVVAVATADYSTIVLKADGVVDSWGSSAARTLSPQTNIVAISSGYGQYLAIRRNGDLLVWGGGGRVPTPKPMSNIVSIAGGGEFGAALTSEGTVVTWGIVPDGRPQFEQIRNPLPPLTNIVSIAAGSNQLVALRNDGKVIVRGAGFYGETNVPANLSNVVAIAAGHSHSLALKKDGSLVGWGGKRVSANITDLNFGQADIPSYLPPISMIAAGGHNSLAMVEQGPPRLISPVINRSVLAGSNSVFYALASGTPPISYQWKFNGALVANATNNYLYISNVTAGRAGSYAVVLSNAEGVVEENISILSVAPLYITANPTNVITFLGGSGSLSTAAAGKTPIRYQWRFNGMEIAKETNSTLNLSNLQLEQAGVYDVVVSNGFGSVISGVAEVSVGRVAVWGENLNEALNLPAGLTNPVAVAASGSRTIVLTEDGRIASWGWPHTEEAEFPPGFEIAQVSVGWNYSLALNSAGVIYAWGANDPPQVDSYNGLERFIAISAGSGHSLGLAQSGSLYANGINEYNQIDIPPGVENVVAISAGGTFSLALSADGTVHSWGEEPPGLETPPTNIVAISAGFQHALALRGDGTVIGWGENGSGQTNVPPALTNAIAIAAGRYFSSALTSEGKVITWGDTIGTMVPPQLNHVFAIAAGDSHMVALLGDAPPSVTTKLSQPILNNGRFSASAFVRNGRVYRLESTGNLPTSNWKARELEPGEYGSRTFTDPTPSAPAQYYRLRNW